MRTRTADLRITNALLYQLSYIGEISAPANLRKTYRKFQARVVTSFCVSSRICIRRMSRAMPSR